MKKLIAMAALLLGLAAVSAQAEDVVISKSEVVASTTIANSSSALLIVTGKGVAYGMIMSTGAATNFAVLRDSGTANLTSIELSPKIPYNATSATVITFPNPIRFYNGLSLNMDDAAVGVGLTVFYKKGF